MSELQLDPDVITRYVSEKIAESAIGESLRTVIDEEVKKLKYSHDNIMKPIVNSFIQQATQDYLDTPEIKARITNAVQEKLTDTVVEELISRAVSNMITRW